MTTTTQADGRAPGAPARPPGSSRPFEARPPAGGREIPSPAARKADLGPTRLGRARSDRAAIRRGSGRRLARRRRMTGDVALELHGFAGGPKTNRTDGGRVRAIAPIPPGGPGAGAAARARRFPPAGADRPHRSIPE